MPELPDVEVFRRRLEKALRRRAFEGARVHDARVLEGTTGPALDQGLDGARLARARRRGKTLYGELRDAPHLRLHFGMTGDLVLSDADDAEPEHTRVTFALSGGHRMHFVDQRRFGEVGLVDDVDEDIAGHGLGPDALDLDLTALRSLLRGSSAGLKALLTDQQQVAGLGNIYTDEILFWSRLDPRAPASEVDDAGIRRLHRQLRRVLERAVAAEVQPARMPRGWLLHRREEGAPCPRENGTIRAFSVGGRRGYWCPACQAS